MKEIESLFSPVWRTKVLSLSSSLNYREGFDDDIIIACLSEFSELVVLVEAIYTDFSHTFLSSKHSQMFHTY